jgi:hypothetical protein
VRWGVIFFFNEKFFSIKTNKYKSSWLTLRNIANLITFFLLLLLEFRVNKYLNHM